MGNYFAKNLKYLRERKDYDQQTLADKLGVPRTTLACWENGIRTPKVEKIKTIADVLGVDIDIISRDYSKENSQSFDELEVLFSNNKDILTEDDKEYIKFIIDKRKKEIDEEKGVNSA